MAKRRKPPAPKKAKKAKDPRRVAAGKLGAARRRERLAIEEEKRARRLARRRELYRARRTVRRHQGGDAVYKAIRDLASRLGWSFHVDDSRHVDPKGNTVGSAEFVLRAPDEPIDAEEMGELWSGWVDDWLGDVAPHKGRVMVTVTDGGQVRSASSGAGMATAIEQAQEFFRLVNEGVVGSSYYMEGFDGVGFLFW